jgi:hypothetical protein
MDPKVKSIRWYSRMTSVALQHSLNLSLSNSDILFRTETVKGTLDNT